MINFPPLRLTGLPSPTTYGNVRQERLPCSPWAAVGGVVHSSLLSHPELRAPRGDGGVIFQLAWAGEHNVELSRARS